MSSYGKVPDLLDERYLNLQDVIGNVKPFPMLLPYEQYVQNILVYRIDTNHEIYLPLLQDFTDRIAGYSRLVSKDAEAWTWMVQWDVESPTADAPTRKKQRLDAGPMSAAQAQAKKPLMTKFERRLLSPELFQEEHILRILIDIVQVESKLVPNYVEFLYQWIDYYEGGGQALKAALRMEIPSLWLFEYHPLPLFSNDGKDKDNEEEVDELEKVAEEMGEKLTTCKRKEPLALEEMERLTEQSERMQYREVKFGIQRPVDPSDEPLPPLINVPHDDKKRQHYYAACFKNRQRAFFLLQEAGITARQIANYKKLQPMSPQETPEDINGSGFLNYYKEEPCAHAVFLEKKRLEERREKQREVSLSSRLAEEARIAATTSAAQENPLLPPALIPFRSFSQSTSHDEPTNPAAAAYISKLREKEARDPPIRTVPAAMLGKCKSKAFRRAAPRVSTPEGSEDGEMEEDEDEDGYGSDEYSNPDDIDPDEREDDHDIIYRNHHPQDVDDDNSRPLASGSTPATMDALPQQPSAEANSNDLPEFLLTFDRATLTRFMAVLDPDTQAHIRRLHPLLNGSDHIPQYHIPNLEELFRSNAGLGAAASSSSHSYDSAAGYPMASQSQQQHGMLQPLPQPQQYLSPTYHPTQPSVLPENTPDTSFGYTSAGGISSDDIMSGNTFDGDTLTEDTLPAIALSRASLSNRTPTPPTTPYSQQHLEVPTQMQPLTPIQPRLMMYGPAQPIAPLRGASLITEDMVQANPRLELLRTMQKYAYMQAHAPDQFLAEMQARGLTPAASYPRGAGPATPPPDAFTSGMGSLQPQPQVGSNSYSTMLSSSAGSSSNCHVHFGTTWNDPSINDLPGSVHERLASLTGAGYSASDQATDFASDGRPQFWNPQHQPVLSDPSMSSSTGYQSQAPSPPISSAPASPSQASQSSYSPQNSGGGNGGTPFNQPSRPGEPVVMQRFPLAVPNGFGPQGAGVAQSVMERYSDEQPFFPREREYNLGPKNNPPSGPRRPTSVFQHPMQAAPRNGLPAALVQMQRPAPLNPRASGLIQHLPLRPANESMMPDYVEPAALLQMPSSPPPPSPLPRDPWTGRLRLLDEYEAVAASPASRSFSQMLESSNRAQPPPNLNTQAAGPSASNSVPGPMTPLAAQIAEKLKLNSPKPAPPPNPDGPRLFNEDAISARSPHGTPIQIYLPKIVIPHDGAFADATDCLVLGYTHPSTGILTLSKAIFFPTTIWPNVLRRVQRGHAEVLETYTPPPNHPRFVAHRGTLRNPDDVTGPHKFVYEKLSQVYSVMAGCGDREEEVTKRWRTTKGPMTAIGRGSVWEGWGVTLDCPVEMGYEERHGAGVRVAKSLDGARGWGLSEEGMREKERREREIDELLEECEEDVSDEEDEEDVVMRED
ncbi:hypothetical protein BU23DRAFT_60807 [Bimuria novae-zelandiae CBS 107.79]|uniref:Uncharacterized protein n=1 Tax=Bimuria novae-zelandiae CBS 107.79 TaxID=1447943 RepID=A0A6A5VGC6_9PLEO|nr:hypothetical protein BU23DRAFT_60807 [Bimuria novae-zelandiae CBS 107.79]